MQSFVQPHGTVDACLATTSVAAHSYFGSYDGINQDTLPYKLFTWGHLPQYWGHMHVGHLILQSFVHPHGTPEGNGSGARSSTVDRFDRQEEYLGSIKRKVS